MTNKQINTFTLRKWVAKTKTLSLEQKRYFLGNFEDLNPIELEELYALSKTPIKKVKLSFFKTNTGKIVKIWGKVFSLFFIFYSIWHIYSTPYGISIHAFPGSIWHTRTALKILKREAPPYHDLVINHIDTLSFTYIEVSGRHDGYAQMTDSGKIKVSLLTQHKLTTPYLSGALVHEACHGKQFHDKRINMRGAKETESRQKIEHECLLLQIDTMERLGAKQRTIDYFKNTGKGNGRYGDSWQKSWKDGDTSMGLMEMLPKEKRIEWNVPGFEDEINEASTENKVNSN